MKFPQCPRCSEKLPIGSFFIRPKRQREGEECGSGPPKVRCGRCRAVIRINPTVYRLALWAWSIAGIAIFPAAALLGFSTEDYGLLLLVIVLAAGGTMYQAWRPLEIVQLPNRSRD